VDALGLLLGTIALRPYVFAFLAAYLAHAGATMGWRRTAAFTGLVWATAFAAEFASTRVGIPFGKYAYLGATRGQELYLANVPFMDSLSFTFLAYASHALALLLLAPWRPGAGRRLGGGIADDLRLRTSPRVLGLGVLLFVLADAVIDPLAVRGERWFLGPVFAYAEPGLYFGVPLSNFAGWAAVGLVGLGLFQRLDARWSRHPGPLRTTAGKALGGALLYAMVLAFNLAVTFWIGEVGLGVAGCLLVAPAAAALVARAWGGGLRLTLPERMSPTCDSRSD
jgi:putative membrane protein